MSELIILLPDLLPKEILYIVFEYIDNIYTIQQLCDMTSYLKEIYYDYKLDILKGIINPLQKQFNINSIVPIFKESDIYGTRITYTVNNNNFKINDPRKYNELISFIEKTNSNIKHFYFVNLIQNIIGKDFNSCVTLTYTGVLIYQNYNLDFVCHLLDRNTSKFIFRKSWYDMWQGLTIEDRYYIFNKKYKIDNFIVNSIVDVL